MLVTCKGVFYKCSCMCTIRVYTSSFITRGCDARNVQVLVEVNRDGNDETQCDELLRAMAQRSRHASLCVSGFLTSSYSTEDLQVVVKVAGSR